jgi:hypothetical protein
VRPLVWWRTGAVYLVVVVTWALFTMLRRVDSALQQMGNGDRPPGSALGFPVSWSDTGASLSGRTASKTVEAVQAAWTEYAKGVSGQTRLRDPFAVAQAVVLLDLCFIVLYAILGAMALVTLGRLNGVPRESATDEQSRRRRAMMLRGATGALVLLCLVDLAEDSQLWWTLAERHPLFQPGGVAVGPLLTLLKLPLAVGVLVPLLFVALMLALESRPLRRTLVSIRAVVYSVGGLFAVFMFGIGAAQSDDVIRAWDFKRAAWAVLAAVALAFTVAGIARYLGGRARERPAPDVGDSAQHLLLGTAAVLILVGLLVLRPLGFGWGLSVAGGILAALWALGLPVDGLPRSPELPGPLQQRRALVQVGTWVLGAAAGAGIALAVGVSVLLGIVLGGVVSLAALVAWSMAASRHQQDDQAGLTAPCEELLASAEAEAARAKAARNDAVTAADARQLERWSALAQQAAEHATAAEGYADAAQAACPAATTRAASIGAQARQDARTAAEAVDTRQMAVWGDRLGRLAGGTVVAILVVAIARATALDAYIRYTPNWKVIGWPLAAAVAAGIGGLAACTLQVPRDRQRGHPWVAPWFLLTVAMAGVALWLQGDRNAATGSQSAGTVSVVLGAFVVVTGVFALLAAAARRGPLRWYALVPVLRGLRFTRFPVLLFLVVWVVAVSALDGGGYHDIRRIPRSTTAPAPTIGQAWQQYLQTAPPGKVRPVVFVAAQGGGIRAAVWTALVMECLFGPGPVLESQSCAQGNQTPDPAQMATTAAAPLPVFLASGASGGSVGLAAWSARRADLVQDGTGRTTPRVVEDALQRDFVASDVARLLLADIPHAFLAWDRADRAEMLERAWEQPWPGGGPGHGLTRGLRETWDVTHAGGSWTTPVLALNGAGVEDGCRFLASAVDFTLPRNFPTDATDVGTAAASTDDRPDDAACRGVAGGPGDSTAVDILPSTSELVDYLCPTEDVPLSTAAHLSARFPYVSPTGRVERRRCDNEDGLVPRPALSYVADGGAFDNSGAGTAVDTWRALAPLAAAVERQTGTCLVPIFLQIDNSPPAPTTSSKADARPDELTAPLGLALGEVSSRDRYARASAAAAFTHAVSAGGQRVQASGTGVESLWFQIALYGQPGPAPPLGWTLAPATVNDMRSQLNARQNQTAIQGLQALLKPGALSCTQS